MPKDNSSAKIVVICGPTATGKTAVAAHLARLVGGEVISADSICVYRGLNIGAAKPTEEEKRGVAHHMIDVADPRQSYSVGDYRDGAIPIVEMLISQGKIPIICGGTGFYINSILFGASYGNTPANPAVREKWTSFAREYGNERLHSQLAAVDPASAASLHPNDVKRVVRALEIYETTGVKKSDINDGNVPRYDYRSFSVAFPREELYSRISQRVDEMMKNGLVDEVEGLLASGVPKTAQSMQGIGYKEVAEGLETGMTETEMAELIKFNTRHYAKRQITFFKRDARLKEIEKDEPRLIAKRIAENIGVIK